MKFTFEKGQDFLGLFLACYDSYFRLILEGNQLRSYQSLNQIIFSRRVTVTNSEEIDRDFGLSYSNLMKVFDLAHYSAKTKLTFELADEELIVSSENRPSIAVAILSEAAIAEDDFLFDIAPEFFVNLATISGADWEQVIKDNLLLVDREIHILPRIRYYSKEALALSFYPTNLYYEGVSSTKTVWGQVPLQATDYLSLNRPKACVPIVAIAITDLITDGVEDLIIADDSYYLRFQTSQGEVIIPSAKALFRNGELERQFVSCYSRSFAGQDLAILSQNIIQPDPRGPNEVKLHNYACLRDLFGDFFPQDDPVLAKLRVNQSLLSDCLEVMTSDNLEVIIGSNSSQGMATIIYLGDQKHGVSLPCSRVVSNLEEVEEEFLEPCLTKNPEDIEVVITYFCNYIPRMSLQAQRKIIARQLSSGQPSLVDEMRLYPNLMPLADGIEGLDESEIEEIPLGYDREINLIQYGVGDFELLYIPLLDRPDVLRKQPHKLYFSTIGIMRMENLCEVLTVASWVKEYWTSKSWNIQPTFS